MNIIDKGKTFLPLGMVIGIVTTTIAITLFLGGMYFRLGNIEKDVATIKDALTDKGLLVRQK